MGERMFPVLMDYAERRRFPDCPREVPWRLLAPHEKQAYWNHGQTLEVLALRGGLGPTEMKLIVEGRSWRDRTAAEGRDEGAGVAWLEAWLETAKAGEAGR